MNELVRPVVVGLDGTEEALHAVRYGVHEAQWRGCGLRLVHAAPVYAPTAPMLPLISVDSVEEVGNRIVSSAAGLVNELTEDQLPVEKIVGIGRPSHILARESEETGKSPDELAPGQAERVRHEGWIYGLGTPS